MTIATQLNTLDSIRACIGSDLAAVDELIIKKLVSPIPLIQAITQHIIKGGGKRLRPLLVILSARAAGIQESHKHHELAAIIEFVHTATLLHDDVVDESRLRRGQKTANAIWDNQASVLVGDFLYSRAFQLLAYHADASVMQVLSSTTNAIAEGEVLQLMNRNDPDITEQAYLEVIQRKTAKLFESSAQIGAMVATEDASIIEALAAYGMHIGIAFQMIDDLLDYTSTPEAIGKNIGDDLAEGKATLPLIYALHQSDEATANQIREVIQHGGLDKLDVILNAIQNTKAAEYTLQCARHHAKQALSAIETLPESHYIKSLRDLVDFAVDRSY